MTTSACHALVSRHVHISSLNCLSAVAELLCIERSGRSQSWRWRWSWIWSCSWSWIGRSHGNRMHTNLLWPPLTEPFPLHAHFRTLCLPLSPHQASRPGHTALETVQLGHAYNGLAFYQLTNTGNKKLWRWMTTESSPSALENSIWILLKLKRKRQQQATTTTRRRGSEARQQLHRAKSARRRWRRPRRRSLMCHMPHDEMQSS